MLLQMSNGPSVWYGLASIDYDNTIFVCILFDLGDDGRNRVNTCQYVGYALNANNFGIGCDE